MFLFDIIGKCIVYFHSLNPPLIHRDITTRSMLLDLPMLTKYSLTLMMHSLSCEHSVINYSS